MNNSNLHKSEKIIIIYDGSCNLCDQTIVWIQKRDKQNIFKFISIEEYTTKDNATPEVLFTLSYINSLVVFNNHKIHTKSAAVLDIVRNIDSWIKIFLIFQFIQPKHLNKIYDYVARKRFLWFGKKSTCNIHLQNDEPKNKFQNNILNPLTIRKNV